MDVEQTEATEQIGEATSTPEGQPSRDDLIAAVREAGGTASVDVDGEERAAVERAKDAPAEPVKTEAAAEDEPRIERILRAREKAHAEEITAKSRADELIAKAREESDKILKEARDRAERDYQDEQSKRRQRFEDAPLEHLRELGDPQAISDAVVLANSPQERAMRALREQLAETTKKAAVADDVKKQLDDFKAERVKAEQDAKIAALRTEYLTTSATKEKAPHLHARFDEDEIFQKADALAWKWSKGGLQIVPVGATKGDNDFDMNDITQYLELDSKKRLAALGVAPAQQVSAGAAERQPGNAPKVSANGTRTLSAAQGSERRTSPKPLSEMKPDEARAALIEEVAAARRANPESVF